MVYNIVVYSAEDQRITIKYNVKAKTMKQAIVYKEAVKRKIAQQGLAIEARTVRIIKEQ